jgi:predicted nuclease of restriction endonuclease-like (RecB) superfamily
MEDHAMDPLAPDSYPQFLADLKTRIRAAQLRASVAINRELVLLYWQIGRDILERQQRESWGAKVIDRLAVDLKREFPDMKGFSVRNLKYMRRFAQAWTDDEFVQQVAAQLPWFHNCVLLDKVADDNERFGTLGPRSTTAGAGQFWSTRSKAVFTAVKERRSPTSIARSRRLSQTSRRKSRRIPITSIF